MNSNLKLAFAVLVGLLFLGLLACGHGQRAVMTPQLESPSAQPSATDAPAIEWPTTLPADGVQPWEEVDANGYVIPPSGGKGASGINLNSQFVPGADRFLEAGTVADLGEASRFTSGVAGNEDLSYAIYRLPMAGEQPGAIAVDANVHINGAYYIGVADYGANTWHWYGPFAVSHVRFTLPHYDYLSGVGNLMLAVVAYDGAGFDLVGLSANARDDTDTTAPDPPENLALTPIPGGVLAEWFPMAAGDLAGYRVYVNGQEALGYVEGGTSVVLAAEGDVEVTVASVDVSGNEGGASDPAATEALPGYLLNVVVGATAASGRRGEVITLNATGADTYDWDVDGDGDYDITGDATGTAVVDTSNLGIIRPALRGHASDGGFSLQAVSLIISGNSRPAVSASATPQSGVAPLTVDFTVTAADDDGTIAEYAWDFEGDGIFDDTSTSNPSPLAHIYATEGLYNAKFRVTDNSGSWDVDTIAVQATAGPVSVEQMETANQVFRGEVASAMQDAAAQAGVQVRTDNFAAALLEDGSSAVVNAGIAGADGLTLDDLSEGADVLFTFLRLPQGSELASGFYTVAFLQSPTGEWLVQFRDQSGSIALQKSAEVGFGDPAQKQIGLTIQITYDPFTLTIDWHLSNASGWASVLLGSGGIDPTPLTPAGQAIASAAGAFSSTAQDIIASENADVQGKIFIASRDDALVAYSFLQGTDSLALDEFQSGQDVMFGYFRMPAKQKKWLPANFRLVRVQGDGQSAEVIWLDTDGNAVATSPGVIGGGSGIATAYWTFVIGPDYIQIDFHTSGFALTISLSDDSEQTAQADIEEANQNFRGGVASALEDAAAQAGVSVRTDDFTAGYLADGSLAAVNASIDGAEDLTPADLSAGADVLFVFLNLPQGSDVPSGFYTVWVYQDSGDGSWHADFKDSSGTVALNATGDVGTGDPTLLSMPKSVTIHLYPPPPYVSFDWSGTGSSGSFSISVGDGGPNTTPLSPAGLKVMRMVHGAGKVSVSDFNIMKRTLQQQVLMFSRDDLMMGQTIFNGVDALSMDEIADGTDVFFGYFHLPQASMLPPGFYTLEFKDPDGNGTGTVRFKDGYGQTRFLALGDLESGTGSDSKILTGGVSGNSIWVDAHVLGWSVTVTLSW